MVDYMPPDLVGSITSESLSSQPDDIMNDPAYDDPPQRRDTISSKAFSEQSTDSTATCRICRSEGSPEEPLFHPCKCSGSIKFVHQECLMEWLSHSHKKHCELCKTPFRFTKLYDANMPAQLPWKVFVKMALVHTGKLVSNTARGLLVGTTWLLVLPWCIRMAWRWMFWFADAGWARDMFLQAYQGTPEGYNNTNRATVNSTGWNHPDMADWIPINLTEHGLAEPQIQQQGSLMDNLAGMVNNFTSVVANITGIPYNATGVDSAPYWGKVQPDTSIFSSWAYLSELTPNPSLNRMILDIFEGQLITCVVILGFILVFLIREWVVQQQPIVNLDQINNVQQQLREATERMDAETARLRANREMKHLTRQWLMQLGQSNGGITNNVTLPESFIGWDSLYMIFDSATQSLRQGDHAGFEIRAAVMLEQMGKAPESFTRVWQRLLDRVLDLGECEERDEWRKWTAKTYPEDPRQYISQNESMQDEREDSEEGSEDTLPPHSSPASNASDSQNEDSQHAALSADEDRTGEHGRSASPSIFESTSSAVGEEVPITNAGPDAKTNIKRSGNGRTRAVPAPKDDTKLIKVGAPSDSQAPGSPSLGDNSHNDGEANPRPGHDNPFHPDGPAPEENDDSLASRVASVFREEFGLDEAEENEQRRQAGIIQDPQAEHDDSPAPEEVHDARPEQAQPTYLGRVVDWFWGDIQIADAPAPVPAAQEERLDENDAAQAPFVPIEAAPEAPPPAANDFGQDPEERAAAAAAQAALDAEAIEDAEDLEGIFELIGLQGPLAGLVQTSMFCLVLVAGTVLGAVGLPFIWGKLVLSIIGSPFYFLVTMPLQIVSFVADFVIDASLFAGGWAAMLTGFAVETLLVALSLTSPTHKVGGLVDRISRTARDTAMSSGGRLADLFWITEPVAAPSDSLGLNGAFLAASVHAHTSLRALENETNAVLAFIWSTITSTVDMVSEGSYAEAWEHAASCTPPATALLQASTDKLTQYYRTFVDVLTGIRNGALTFTVPASVEVAIDPELVYWSSTDRSLAVLTGYVALALAAAVYVAADTPITSSPTGQRTEKIVRDTLRQAGGVLKVILIISIEMLLFPLYCGMLLDFAFLPLFEGASMATRLAFAASKPYTFCFVHWFAGTCYMFHFALFVGMCRKILRKGVLWFIRDPDDPTFHPVRDVLERNVTTQLRKIAFSALVYGALVILCLGGVIWTIGKAFKGIFPICWISTEPVLEFPLDLLLYNFLAPLVIRLFKPSNAVHAMYGWWLRRCARVLRISHFLFDDRRKDEEGHYVRKSWSSFLLMKTSDSDDESCAPAGQQITADGEVPEVYFMKDGKYVLTPCNDQYRPPKPNEAFIHYDDDDVYITDKYGKKNEHFAKVYVPPLFRLRVTLFMVCLWVFSAFTGLCTTLVPLVFGRRALAAIAPDMHMNDIYAYSVGAYTLGGLLFILLKGSSGVRHLKEKADGFSARAWLVRVKTITLQTLKCLYVYGFLGIVLPLIFALVLQFYLILPMHTYAVSLAAATNSAIQQQLQAADASSLATNLTNNLLGFTQFNQTSLTQNATAAAAAANPSGLAHHSMHILQDYALGLLYVRIATRFVTTAPSSRASEAFRRITANGYLNPNPRLATRYFILPALVTAAIILLAPMGGAWVGIQIAQAVGLHDSRGLEAGGLTAEAKTKFYRYAYPAVSGLMGLVWGFVEVGKATGRWRAMIRDEVYLVGEKLHNFGERRPPVGGRSVVRRER